MSGRPSKSGRTGRPVGTDFFTFNPDVADAVEAILAKRKLSAPQVLELLGVQFDLLPSLRTLQAFIAKLEAEKPALLASMRDPDLYKSKYRLALGRADGGITRAHQRWEIDTTKADVMTVGGRCMILGVIDVFSRQARFLVAKSESGQSVRKILIDTITAWGVVPEQLGTDNGSGYINRSVVSALEILGIEADPCLPGQPERKPFIERLFGTFTRERAPFLPGFTGHSVSDAQRLRAKAKKDTGRAVIEARLSADELQAVLSAWTEGVYNVRRHGTLRMSPRQKALTSPAPARQAPSPQILKMALSAHVGNYVVGKRGIQWRHGRYWSPALIPYLGRRVEVRYDEDDIGEILVFAEDGRFIDAAVNYDRQGTAETDVIKARAKQARQENEERARVRRNQKALNIDELMRRQLERDAEAAGKLAYLPRPTVPHSTPTLDSMRDAPEPALPSEAEIARVRARVVALPKAEPTVADKVAAADRLMQSADAGDLVDDAALVRARRYAASSEYRAHKTVAGAFAKPDRKGTAA